MDSGKNNWSSEKGGKDRKTKQSHTSHGPSTKRAQSTTAVSTQIKASTSRASYTNISTHTPPEVMTVDAANIYQTSHGHWLPGEVGQTPVDLLGLASPMPPGDEFEGNLQASQIDLSGAIQTSECNHHRFILTNNNFDKDKKDMGPMTRWLAEGNAEQNVVLHLPDGQLSIHKDCQCSNVMPLGMEMEIEE